MKYWRPLTISLLAAGLVAAFAFGYLMQVGWSLSQAQWEFAWNAAWLGSLGWAGVLALLFRKSGWSRLWGAVALGGFWSAQMAGEFAPFAVLNSGPHSLASYGWSENGYVVWWRKLPLHLAVMFGVWFIAGLVLVWLTTIPAWLQRQFSHRLSRAS